MLPSTLKSLLRLWRGIEEAGSCAKYLLGKGETKHHSNSLTFHLDGGLLQPRLHPQGCGRVLEGFQDVLGQSAGESHPDSPFL